MQTQHAPSLWEREEDNDEKAPRYCPHCGEQLAHPDNMRDNDDLEVSGRMTAYRRHRQAHFEWGTDPTDLFRGGDPYLADYYDGVETEGTGPTLDEDEEVASVYDVEINYEARLTARVVAPDEHHAKERAQDLRKAGKDLHGNIPEALITHELHDTAREVKTLTRGEIQETVDVDEDVDDGINYADRLPGWPW